MNNNQSGRSMLEILAVLVIIAIMTVGAVVGIKQATDKYKTSKIYNDIQYISDGFVNLYAWKGSYPTEVDKAILCENDIFPDGCSTGNEARNPYGGTYKLTTSGDFHTITVDKLPATVCDDLDLHEWPYLIEKGCTGSGEDNRFTIKFE